MKHGFVLRRFFLPALFLVAGCGKSSSNLTTASTGNSCLPGVDCLTQFTETTDRSHCNTPPISYPQVTGTWIHKRHYIDGHDEISTYTITDASTEISTICSENTSKLSESVTVDSRHGTPMKGVLQILGHNEKSESTTMNNGKVMNCSADLELESYNYSIEGNCLVFSAGQAGGTHFTLTSAGPSN